MEIFETSISRMLIIESCVLKYSCGYFSESFSQREFDDKVPTILGHRIHFVQGNESMHLHCSDIACF